MRRSAAISSEYGTALDSSATPSPASSVVGTPIAAPACAMPTGTANTAATSMPSDTACPLASVDTRLPNTMYIAHDAAAPNANSSPSGSSGAFVESGNSSARPASASATHATSSARRDATSTTTSGPVVSIAVAMPIGMRPNA